MSIGVGKTQHSKHYPDTKGLKVAGNQFVKAGTILTRQGNKWKAGINVGNGKGTLYALVDGKVYFRYRRGKYNKRQTFINIEEIRKKK